MVVLSEKDPGLVPPPPYFAIEHGNDFTASKPSSSSLSPSPSSVHLQHSSSSSHATETAPALPSHILLLIVYSTLPYTGEYRLDRVSGMRVHESAAETAVRTTRTLYWMAFCLRAVNRGFYLAAMHILRSTFLPYYVQRVRPPYSSDPFPHTSLSSHHAGGPSSAGSSSGYRNSESRYLGSVVSSVQCESEVLDLYILHQLHEDVFADDSSLHTARPETLRDLFDFMQPRARLADLVRAYGAGAGLVALSDSELIPEAEEDEEELVIARPSSSANRGPDLNLKAKFKLAHSTSTLTLTNPSTSSSIPSASPSASRTKLYTYTPSPLPALAEHSRRCATTWRRKKILYTALRIAFSPRRVGLVYTATGVSPSGPRTIVDLPRVQEEPLERSASRLVAGLKTWLDSSGVGAVPC